jgi:hypothetical protein
MSKTHIINLNIQNNSGGLLLYSDDWFQTGRLADGCNWPTVIDLTTAQVQCCESPGIFAGCSGWVKYTLNNVPIYFSFSNPFLGDNGIGVGTTTEVWNDMGGHYFPVEVPILLSEGNWLNVTIDSTSGETNEATWKVESCDLVTIRPSNLEIVNVKQVWSSLSASGTRRYFKSKGSPTDLAGLANSHFKGLSVYADKFIFTHTNLDLISTNANGKYMIADQLWDQKWNQATVDRILDTLHPGWAHVCASQACGSFMAMGIQEAVDSTSSEIQILDIRMTEVNQPATLLGTIQIPLDGVNGVGMTKETGADGRYLVAGINGNMLNVYRSSTSSLITGGAPTVHFDTVLTQKIEDSGPGLALVTQEGDGAIYMFALNADAGQDNNAVNLYKLDLEATPTTCTLIGTKHMQIPGMSDSVTLLGIYAATLGPIVEALLIEYGASYLNSSFRWGKGLAITSPNTIQVYASDRNVLPLSNIPVVGSDKEFSVVTWTSAGSTWKDQLYVLFQGNDSDHTLYVTSSTEDATFPAFTTPAIGCANIAIGSAPAVTVFMDKLFIAFQANDPSNKLYVTSSADGINFEGPATGYGDIPIGSAPAMAVFLDQLFIAYQAKGTSNTLYVTSSADGITFKEPAGYSGIEIGSNPAMAVFMDQLFIAFKANDSSNTLYLTSTTDGITFANPAIGYSIKTGSAPAMAVFMDKLFIAFQGSDLSHTLYITWSTDGINFTTPAVAYPGISIGSAPAMAVADNCLFISFRANDSSHTLYVTYSMDGSTFLNPATDFPGIQIGSAPAMVEFQGLVRGNVNRP